MKKKIFTSFIFCFFFSAVSFYSSAQDYKYDISKYYTPDIVRNSLDFDFNSYGSYTNTKDKYIVNYLRSDTTNGSSLNGSINSTFLNLKNTRKRISSIQLTGNFQIANSSYNPGIDIYSNRSFNSSNYLGLTYSNRYYKTKNHFLSFGINSFLNDNVSKNNTGNASTFSNNYKNNAGIGLSPSIGIGTGRIESVEDARQALYILKELSGKGVLTRQLTDDEIFNLSQQISRVKNKRFLDSRLHLMDEIASVDSFFVNNNLIDKSDATYFTNLYDLWVNGANFSRKSGHEFRIDFSPSVSWYYNKNQLNSENGNDTTTDNQKNYNGNLAFSYSYEKPVNLNWQHSVNAVLYGYSNFQKNRTNTQPWYNLNYSGVNFNGSYTIGYFPNTRTNLRVGISETLNQDYSKSYTKLFDSNPWYKSFTSITSFNFTAYYYLSAQLRISGNASLYKKYNKNDYGTINDFNTGFSAGLNYSFF